MAVLMRSLIRNPNRNLALISDTFSAWAPESGVARITAGYSLSPKWLARHPQALHPGGSVLVRWQAVFRATPLFPASPRMQTSRNGVESQNRQKCLNMRCVCPGMSREPSTSRIGEGWGIKITIMIMIRIMIEAEHNTPGIGVGERHRYPSASRFLVPLSFSLAVRRDAAVCG